MASLNKPYNNLENMDQTIDQNTDEKNILRVASALKPCTLVRGEEKSLSIARENGLEIRSVLDFRAEKQYYDDVRINDNSSLWYGYFKDVHDHPPTYVSMPRTFESFYNDEHINAVAGYFGRIEPKLEERIKSLYTFVKNLIVAEAGVFLHMFPTMDFELPHDNDGNIDRLEVMVLSGLLFGYDINETEHSTEELVKHELGLPNRFTYLE